ncbi:hypothetical protein ABT168_08885 [Streptomyces sp. NPDC001793]|uniref:hypothetical protein n=1 Tax=Streptomyces sp. NPDC001793 TaxID=3154657 RepID=UPI00332CA343
MNHTTLAAIRPVLQMLLDLADQHPDLPLTSLQCRHHFGPNTEIVLQGEGAMEALALWSQLLGVPARHEMDFECGGRALTSYRVQAARAGIPLSVSAIVENAPDQGEES